MKRLALFIFTLLCANVLSAQTEFIVGNLKYKVSSSNPQIVSVGAADATITTANIPATVTYQGTTYTVTSIGGGAFADCSSLTSVTIPNSVTSIGSKTFFGCSSLITITIPNSVTSIGPAVFYGCSSLTSVSLGTGITSLRSYNAYEKAPTYGFFHDCSSLTSVIFEDNSNLTYIGYTWEMDTDYDFGDIDEKEIVPTVDDKDYDFGDIDNL